MESNKKVEVIEFTDPVCTWCWGSEPILRKLEAWYGDRVAVKYIMGGLVKDIREFYDSYNDIGRDAERSNKQIAKHWLEASERHGMPVKSDGFRLFSDEYPSTYPQNIAYKAAQMEGQALADKFLRRMREASAAEARQTSKMEVLMELASEVGIDISKFSERMADGTAQSAFNDDLKIAYEYGVRGFPSFLIRYNGKEMMLRSYQRFESFEVAISTLTENSVKGAMPEYTEQNIMDFIKRYGRVAPVELQMCFELTEEETKSVTDTLVSKKLCRTVQAGNGIFIENTANPALCDDTNGVCGL